MRQFMFILVVAVLSSGCAHTFHQPRLVELEKPARPVLENVAGEEMKKMSVEAQTAVSRNFSLLLGYVKKLEIAIDTYNVYAVEKNMTLGTGDKDD